MKHFLWGMLLTALGTQVAVAQTVDPCSQPAPRTLPKVTRIDRVLRGLHLQEKPLGRTAIDSLKESDRLFNNPFAGSLVTPRAYSRLRYRNMVAVGGFNIKQGHAAGTSLTVDDKGGALNLGLVPVADTGKLPKVALLATVKATADNGLVTLFSGGEYQKTLGFGGGVLWFFPVPSRYQERAKKDVQWQYRQLRQRDSTAWRSSYEPVMPADWKRKNAKALREFVAAWADLNQQPWSHDYYQAKQGQWMENQANRSLMARYWRAEHAVRSFLPAKWDESEYKTADQERSWLTQLVQDAAALHKLRLDRMPKRSQKADKVAITAQLTQNKLDTLAAVRPDTAKINCFLETHWRQVAAMGLLRSSLKRIEAMQDSATWHKLPLRWVNVNGLFNTTQQPVLKPTGTATDFADKQRDNYWTGQLTFNWLDMKKKSNWYWTAGLGGENRRPFDPKNLQTYQVASPAGSGGTLQLVEQKQLYPGMLDHQFALIGLAGATYYHHGKLEWGLSTAFSQKMFGSHQTQAMVGVFTPVKAGEANILLMPLVRYDSEGTPHHWTVGVSLTTTFPAFMTGKTAKGKG